MHEDAYLDSYWEDQYDLADGASDADGYEGGWEADAWIAEEPW
jgi:hypothetical protein